MGWGEGGAEAGVEGGLGRRERGEEQAQGQGAREERGWKEEWETWSVEVIGPLEQQSVVVAPPLPLSQYHMEHSIRK